MEVLIINQSEVAQLLPMYEAIDLMAGAFRTLARAEAQNPLRQVMWLPDRSGLLGMMPAHLADIQSVGLKAISVFPGNERSEYDSHQGVVLLFGTGHGRLRAIVDASAITAIRTAAVSGVATILLARQEAEELAILGSGVQAQAHLEAMLVVRNIKRVRVWSRTLDHARSLAEVGRQHKNLEIEAVHSAQQAVLNADIVCTATAAKQPILYGDWLTPGVHVNAVGASDPSARELDVEAVVRSRLYVDRMESTLHEAGCFLTAREEGALDDGHIQGEIGDLLLGRIRGRESAEEITLFKSLGLGVEDLAAAHHVYQKALKQNLGTWVELGGDRELGR